MLTPLPHQREGKQVVALDGITPMKAQPVLHSRDLLLNDVAIYHASSNVK
jgi:hypothetical protein